jgi:hypothetical protein
MVYMKKGIILSILFLNVLFAVFSQNSGPIDLILILDTSQEMSPSYEKVNDYITGDFLREFLRIGDTFHLICFSSKQRVDIARRIQGRGDIETIIGRMLLQYPLENGKDYPGVLNFAQDYVSSLPQRAKKIVIVSAGGPRLDNAVNAVRQNFTSRNITVDVVQVNQGQTFASLPRSNRPAARSASTQQTPSSDNKTTAVTQTVTQPDGDGKNDVSAGKTSPAPLNITDVSDIKDGSVSAPGTKDGGSDAPLVSGTKESPGSDTQAVQGINNGSSDTALVSGIKSASDSDTTVIIKDDTGFSSDKAIIPDTQNQEILNNKQVSDTDSDVYNETGAEKTFRAKGVAISVPLFAGLAVIALIILILIIIFVTGKLRSSPNRAIADAALYSGRKKEDNIKFENHSNELAKYAAAQSSRRTTPYQDKPVRKIDEAKTEINPNVPLLLNMFVEDQNTAIGKRNIHSLKSGYTLSVGGGNSDFLIFLVPVPANIGELNRDGSKLTFIPRKPKYFPDIGSSEVSDCLNKTIRVISGRNYEIRFRFEMWEDPLIALNKFLNSFRIPG